MMQTLSITGILGTQYIKFYNKYLNICFIESEESIVFIEHNIL